MSRFGIVLHGAKSEGKDKGRVLKNKSSQDKQYCKR